MPFDGSTFVAPAAIVIARETQAAEQKRRRADRIEKERARMRAAAENYIQADRSDPFTRARVMTHIDNGVAAVRREGNHELEVSAGMAFYGASRSMTMRRVAIRGEIIEVPTAVFTNVVRP